MPGLTDFRDIYEAVMEQLKVPTSDTTTLERVKRDINMTYQQEVAPFKRWPWLIKRVDVTHEGYYAAGTSDTASVTQGSTTVTLSAPVPVAKGSLAGYRFAADQFSEIYTIDTHTAGTDTLELTTTYKGETSSEQGFKAWRDKFDLPTDARETVGVRHDYKNRDMIPRGAQKLDELIQQDHRREEYPHYYSTDDYFDPSSGDPETETDRYRQVRLWPSVWKDDITLHVDYTQEVTELSADGDEPVMPIEDRVVLVYGALVKGWLRDRNPEAAAIAQQQYDRKIAQMAAKTEDSNDHPRIEIDDNYMEARRNTSVRRYNA